MVSEMPFQLLFQGGPTLALNDALVVRKLGAPVRWHFLADLDPDSLGQGTAEAGLGRLLVGGPVTVKALWQPDDIVICPAAKVVALSRPGQTGTGVFDWSGYVRRLDIVADSTAPAGGSDPFLPRRRVHKVKNMWELMDRFKQIAEPIQRVRAKLLTLEFPDKDKASIIQDGISDWLFFGNILDQCRFLAPQANWLPLTLVGGADQDAGTAGKWIVTPGLKAPYVEWNELGRRKISFDDADGKERLQFSHIEGFSRVPAFPSAMFPAFGVGRPWREFQLERWRQWSNLDLPRFTARGDMIWCIQDRISRSLQNKIGWETFVFAAPPETQVVGPLQSCRLYPWIGSGKVKQTSKKGPWIQVQLKGFEDGSDLADVRLCSPFSGTDGKRGLHFVPEQGTDVQVCWSGRFDSSVVLGGNTRVDPTDFDSPSVFLEATHTAQYQDVRLRRIGEVVVDSNLAMAVKQGTTLDSHQPLKIRADGADLKLNNGVVYTGRGF